MGRITVARDLGMAWHGLAGGIVMLLAVGGFSRELVQHDWPLSPHQWLEALAWPAVGLVVAFLAWPMIKRLRKP